LNTFSFAQKQPRIAIARLSAIGDAIMTMPVVCALRQHYPEAFITWIAEPGAGALLNGHACIDELVVLPKGWLKSPRTVLQLRKRLHAMQIDVALDPQSLSKSAIAAWLTGARCRIGFQSPKGREISLLLNTKRHKPRKKHNVDAQLEFLQYLDIKQPEVQFKVPRDAGAERAVARFCEELQLAETFASINPGASWNSKRWPADRFGRVAKYLGEQHGMQSIVVWSGEEERAWAEEIAQIAGPYAVVSPATRLPELAALLRRANLFVSSDTGPAHLAAAVGTPVVGLFGPTLPEVTGPYGAQHIALQAFHQTGPALRRSFTPNTAMLAITIEDVCRACDEILDRPNDAISVASSPNGSAEESYAHLCDS